MTLAPTASAEDPATQTPAYLAANYGFEGIIGIPGLLTVDDLQRAIDAGAARGRRGRTGAPVRPGRRLIEGRPTTS